MGQLPGSKHTLIFLGCLGVCWKVFGGCVLGTVGYFEYLSKVLGWSSKITKPIHLKCCISIS